MMSSDETSSPVSASTFAYLMRWPVFRLIWLKLIFSESEVAGYKATGQVTSERRKKPFQLARGAIQNTPDARELGLKTNEDAWFRQRVARFFAAGPIGNACFLVLDLFLSPFPRYQGETCQLSITSEMKSSTCAARWLGSAVKSASFNGQGSPPV